MGEEADQCACGGVIVSDVYYIGDQEVQENECSSCGLVYG